jgi:hypothetical protein
MGPFVLADGFAFDPTGSRFAFIVKSGKGYYAVIDGRPFGPTQEQPLVEFSDDGERFMFGDTVKQLIYVIDRRYHVERYKYFASASSGKSRDPWGGGNNRSAQPHRIRNAFSVSDGAKEAALVNGIKGPPFDKINRASGTADESLLDDPTEGWDFAFDANGNHFAYVAKIGGRACIVKDNESSTSECYERILRGTLLVASDGMQTAYVAGDHTRQFAVFNGKREQPFDEIGLPHMSPDGSTRAYAARVGKNWTAVIDGTAVGSYEYLSDVTFSPVGNRLAFVGWRGGKQFCIVDGREGARYADILGPVFSADGKHLAYVARASPDSESLVLDGKDFSGPHRSVGQALFSPDGGHIAYVVDDGEGVAVVVDKNPPGRRYARIVPDSLSFSEDGTSVAYVGEEKQNRVFVAVNDQAYGPYAGVDDLRRYGYVSFVPGTSHSIYAVDRGASDLLMIDGRPAFNLRCVIPGRSQREWSVYGCLSATLTKITVSADPPAAPQ